MGQQIYKGRIVDRRVERVRLPNGTAVALELMHRPGASAVVAVDDGGRVVLIRQYRHAAGGYIWELPAAQLLPPRRRPPASARRAPAPRGRAGRRAPPPPPRARSTPASFRPPLSPPPVSRRPARRPVRDAAPGAQLRDAGALVEVGRGFPDGAGAPPTPAADLEGFAAELVLADLAVVEKRLERLKKEKGHERERALLERLAPSLEAGTPPPTPRLAAPGRGLAAGVAVPPPPPPPLGLHLPQGP